MANVQIWNGTTSINGISAEQILANRQDLANALGDIFLVVNDNGKVTEIQIGSIIASNYGMSADLTLQEIADAYMTKKEEERLQAEEEKLTVNELQEEVATLSYDVMMLQPDTVSTSALSTEGHSPKFKMIRIWYKKGFWTKDMVQDATNKGVITQEEFNEIVNK